MNACVCETNSQVNHNISTRKVKCWTIPYSFSLKVINCKMLYANGSSTMCREHREITVCICS